MIGLILAAGEGKRLNDDLPEKTVKSLVKINNKSLIEYSLKNCSDVGVERVIIVVSDSNREAILSEIGEEFCGMQIIYCVQESPCGLVNAIMSSSEYLNDSVMLQLSDEIFIQPKISECIKDFDSGSDFVVTYVYENDAEKIRNNFSVSFDDDENIVCCTEKPRDIINNLKGTGLCVFSAECIDFLKQIYNPIDNSPDNLCDYINLLIESKKTGKLFCIAEEEININTAKELNYIQKMIKDGNVQ